MPMSGLGVILKKNLSRQRTVFVSKSRAKKNNASKLFVSVCDLHHLIIIGKSESFTYPTKPPPDVHFTVGALAVLSALSLVPAVIKPASPGHSIIRYQKERVRPCLH